LVREQSNPRITRAACTTLLVAGYKVSSFQKSRKSVATVVVVVDSFVVVVTVADVVDYVFVVVDIVVVAVDNLSVVVDTVFDFFCCCWDCLGLYFCCFVLKNKGLSKR
jgi:hypothetical protein